MIRLPVSGSDDGVWGDLLNGFLQVAHDADGSLKGGVVGATQITDGTITLGKLAVTGTPTTGQLLTYSGGGLAWGDPIVSSVAGRTGTVTLTKSDVGLANVDNTSDASKPVSAATQSALDLKADAANVGAKVLLIDNAAALPAGTPAGVVVVVKA